MHPVPETEELLQLERMNVPLLASYVPVVDLFVLLDPLFDSPLFHKMACIGHIKAHSCYVMQMPSFVSFL